MKPTFRRPNWTGSLKVAIERKSSTTPAQVLRLRLMFKTWDDSRLPSAEQRSVEPEIFFLSNHGLQHKPGGHSCGPFGEAGREAEDSRFHQGDVWEGKRRTGGQRRGGKCRDFQLILDSPSPQLKVRNTSYDLLLKHVKYFKGSIVCPFWIFI